MLRTILLAGGIIAAILAVLIFSGKLPIGNNSANTPQGEVVLWGTFPEAQMDKIIQAFNPQAKTYRVVYREIRSEVFAQTLTDALANGTGPDIILAPHQIILSQTPRLYPFPLTSFSEKAFKDTYVDGASIFFSPSGALALPVSIEPMVLFFNRTLFSKHGIVSFPKCADNSTGTTAPPYACWDQITNLVPQLTSMDNKGQFVESGIDLGSPNTPYAGDILMSIVSQLGQTPVLVQYNQDGTTRPTVMANLPTTEGGQVFPLATVARFFSQFADPTKNTYSWSQFAGNASDQFVAEKLAMYVGYSGEFPTLQARNPKGDFDMTYFPQSRGYNTFATGARMYGIATLKSSKNITAALTVEAQFAGGGISPSIAAIVNGAPAIRAYANTPGLNEVVAHSMLVARGWYDSFPLQSMGLVASLLSDIINNRYGVSDASNIFISRLQDLYTPQ